MDEASMTWIKLEDDSVDHPKIAGLTDRAFRWWIRGLCYASRFLTDGVLPKVFYANVPKQVRVELTEARLWDFDDPNLLIHDYLSHQQSREKVEGKRKYAREQKQKVSGNLPVVPEKPSTPDTENREQKTDTEGRESASRSSRARGLIVSPLEYERKHGHHLGGFCDWVCFPMELVDRFAKRIPGEDDGLKRAEIKSWALVIRATWADRVVPDGSDFDFWTNRWTETHGGSRPANATLKAARAASDLDEAFR